jgi:hypothetical protein
MGYVVLEIVFKINWKKIPCLRTFKGTAGGERFAAPKSLATFTTCEVAEETDVFNECFETDADLRSKVRAVENIVAFLDYLILFLVI